MLVERVALYVGASPAEPVACRTKASKERAEHRPQRAAHFDGDAELEVVVVDREHDGVHRRLPALLLGVAAGAVVERGARLVVAGLQLQRRLEEAQGLRQGTLPVPCRKYLRPERRSEP